VHSSRTENIQIVRGGSIFSQPQNLINSPTAPSLFDIPSRFISDACSFWVCPSEERTILELKELPIEERKYGPISVAGTDDFAIKRDTCIAANQEEELLVQLNEELQKVERLLPSIPAVKNYISQRTFRLMFLRSNQGNSAAAAKQIVKHLHLKRRLVWKSNTCERYRAGGSQ
jgi:hypothetical protein